MKKILLFFLFSFLFFNCVSSGDNSSVVNDISPDVNIEFPNTNSDSIVDDYLNEELNSSLLSFLI